MIKNLIEWLHDKLNLCHHCHRRKVKWIYMPSSSFGYKACEKCVPRGCSCNQYPKDGDYDNHNPENWEDNTDKQGRKLPCCEWVETDTIFTNVKTGEEKSGVEFADMVKKVE